VVASTHKRWHLLVVDATTTVNQMDTKVPLFSPKPWTDWTFIFGLGVGGLSAFQDARNLFLSVATPTTSFFAQGDWLGASLDAIIAVTIGVAIFGVIPAAIRRRRRLSHPNYQAVSTGKSSPLPFIPIGVVLTACFAIFAADVEARSQLSQRFSSEQLNVLSALNKMSTAENEAFTRLSALPGEWNKYSFIWVGLTNDNSLSAQEFLDKSDEPIAAMSDIVAQMDDALVSLAGTPMSDVYEPVIVNYHDKLDAVKAYSRAIQSGDPNALTIVIADFKKIGEEAKVVVCRMLAAFSDPPYNEFFSAEDLTKLSGVLVTC